MDTCVDTRCAHITVLFQKITIALEELGLPYQIHPINIGAGAQFAPEYLKISPNNKIPAIVDPAGPDGQPISIFEVHTNLAMAFLVLTPRLSLVLSCNTWRARQANSTVVTNARESWSMSGSSGRWFDTHLS